MIGYRSPGRREMRDACKGHRWQPEVYPMRGNVPREFEEDRQFYLLFQESKRLEAKLPATQAKYNACISKLVARGRELMPPKTESATQTDVALLGATPPQPPALPAQTTPAIERP